MSPRKRRIWAIRQQLKANGRRRDLAMFNCAIGHRNPESTVRYLGIEVDDALELSEHLKSAAEAGAAYGPLAGITGRSRGQPAICRPD